MTDRGLPEKLATAVNAIAFITELVRPGNNTVQRINDLNAEVSLLIRKATEAPIAREEPDSRMTIQDLIDRLLLFPEDIRNRYIVQVGGEFGMGDLTARGLMCNHLDETVCLDNDPM